MIETEKNEEGMICSKKVNEKHTLIHNVKADEIEINNPPARLKYIIIHSDIT